MVLPAVLRHPARNPEQAHRCHRAARLNRAAGLLALARYLAGAVGKLSAAVPAVPDRFLPCGGRARLSWLAATRRWLRDRGSHTDRLLFHFLADHPAAARLI